MKVIVGVAGLVALSLCRGDEVKEEVQKLLEKVQGSTTNLRDVISQKTGEMSEEGKQRMDGVLEKFKTKISETDLTALNEMKRGFKEKPEEARSKLKEFRERIKLTDVKQMTAEQKDAMEAMRSTIYEGVERSVGADGKIPEDKKPKDLDVDFLKSMIESPKEGKKRLSMKEMKEKLKEERPIWLSQLTSAKKELKMKAEDGTARLVKRLEKAEVTADSISITGDEKGPKVRFPDKLFANGADLNMAVTPLDSLSEEDRENLLSPIVRVEAYSPETVKLIEMNDLPEPVVVEMPDVDKATCEGGKAAYIKSDDTSTEWTSDDTCTAKYSDGACRIESNHLTDFTIQKGASTLFASTLLLFVGALFAMLRE